MFKIGNNFELLYLEKELCQTFNSPKIFKDMKFVTSKTELFKNFKPDFKALVSFLNKLLIVMGLRAKYWIRNFYLACFFYLMLASS